MTIKLSSAFHFFAASAAIGLAISYGKLYMFHISLITLVILLVTAYTKKDIPATKGSCHKPFYIITSWYALSILWASNKIYAINYTIYFTIGLTIIIACVLFITTTNQLTRVLKLLGIIYVIQVTLALFEVFTNFRLPISPYSPYSYYFGWKNDLGQDFNPIQLAYLTSMPTGFHWNPNNLSAVLVIVLPFALTQKRRLIKLGGTISILILIIAASSRAAFLGALVVLLIFGHLRRRRLIFLVGILAAIFISIDGIELLKQSEVQKVADIATVFDVVIGYLFEEGSASNSVGIRRRLTEDGLTALLNSYGLGLGGGGSMALQESLGMHARVSSMHNFWIEVLVEGGIFIGVLFVSWYAYMILRLRRISQNDPDPFLRNTALSLWVGLCGFSLALIGASSVVYLLPMWILFGISCSVVNMRSHTRMRVAHHTQTTPRNPLA